MEIITKATLWGELNLATIENNPDFKEDSVREVIIHPLLVRLGYKENNIIRSKSLKHPFLKVGSGSKKRKITLIPDYTLQIEGNHAWVLDAKSPKESVTNDDNIEQVYLYASHPEIRSTYFALCNGQEFALFRREEDSKPILYFSLIEIEHYWGKINFYLSPGSFQVGKNFSYSLVNDSQKPVEYGFDYKNRPLLDEIPVKKQAAKRHFGVHGYFTKQAWNVVANYIKNFSKPGDIVLDPFGGSGVTAIESLMNDRKTIHIDLNPMSVFIVDSLITPVDHTELLRIYDEIKKQYTDNEPSTDDEIKIAIKKYPYPKGFKLPTGSDVKIIENLFTKRQLAQLAFLKSLIDAVTNESVRKSLLLAFSSTLTKINRTYHNSSQRDENAGDCAAFRYYRYRIAPEEVELNVWRTYETKFKKVLSAKHDIEPKINTKTIGNATIIKGTATNYKWIPNESIDYIYTDPPYGKKIPYLDLSVMWNAWLGLEVTNEDLQQEAIVGGEQDKSKDEYNTLISESIKEMYRVLKFDRWLSFVFAHKDPEFWHLIVETAEQCGFEYVGAMPQKNGQSSFKKRQHPFTVLSGQLIINFRKSTNPKVIMKANLGMDISKIIMQTIEGIIAKNNGASLEQINDELIVKGLELGFLHLLKKTYSNLTPILLSSFNYDNATQLYTLKEDSTFKTHIDLELRIRYYLISYLRRMERENINPTFDEIVMNIMPLLTNGLTPEHQTISKVLTDIGEHIGQNMWKLKSGGQQKLFL
jgi:16S rRNA G966 N2-methylase RsmD